VEPRVTVKPSAIVTGAASGVGRALSRELARRGVAVTACDVDEEGLRTLVAELGGDARAERLDVRDAAAFTALVEAEGKRRGGLDYLFNNAGVITHKPALEHTPEEWRRTVDVNVLGTMNGCVAALPLFKAQGRGHLVNTASIAGLVPMSAFPVYSFTKFAVVGLSLNLRAELRRHGIRVTVLCPGGIRTPMTAPLTAGLPEGEAKVREKMNLDPDVFARAAVDDVMKNRAICIRPRWARLLWWLFRLFPSFGNALVKLK
jgi:NAD(P)-dependent dehydrogenase (short-subunit alcohol dehydrogenase family)